MPIRAGTHGQTFFFFQNLELYYTFFVGTGYSRCRVYISPSAPFCLLALAWLTINYGSRYRTVLKDK